MMQFGGGVPGELPITMASRMQLGGVAHAELPITMCKQPSQGDARLAALAAKFPNGATLPTTLAPEVPAMPAIANAAGGTPLPATSAANVPATPPLGEAAGPLQIEDAKPADASETPESKSKLSALAAKILAVRGAMKDDRAKALRACMYF